MSYLRTRRRQGGGIDMTETTLEPKDIFEINLHIVINELTRGNVGWTLLVERIFRDERVLCMLYLNS